MFGLTSPKLPGCVACDNALKLIPCARCNRPVCTTCSLERRADGRAWCPTCVVELVFRSVPGNTFVDMNIRRSK